MVKRTLGRLPMLIAEANNSERPDAIRRGWFSPAMLDGRTPERDPEGPRYVTCAVFDSWSPRARGLDGEWDRAIVNQKSVVSVFSMLDDEDGGHYYNNLLNEHLPPGTTFGTTRLGLRTCSLSKWIM